MPPKGWSKKEGRVVRPTSRKRRTQMRKNWRKMQKEKDPLTEREKQFLYFIRSYQMEERCSPTIYEMSVLFYMSHRQAADIVESLTEKGFIEKTTDKGRSGRIKFPKGIKFPWEDEEQFPSTVFLPPERSYLAKL